MIEGLDFKYITVFINSIREYRNAHRDDGVKAMPIYVVPINSNLSKY